MREIYINEIISAIREMCIEANYNLNDDIRGALESGLGRENSPIAKSVLGDILKNADIAKEERVPICQDTGMAVVFMEIGQEAAIVGGSLRGAVDEGVRQGYEDGWLRKSVVRDPIRRGNTGDNTPAVLHTEIIDGDKIKISIAPKGFGSENMSAVKMLKPSDGIEGVIDFVTETARRGGSNPCPPIVVGVGIGGTMEKAALMSKHALLRDIRESNPDKFYADLEQTLLEKINESGVGPQGLGGVTTALGVNVETYPTHIAGLPVAVNISCHVTRHLSRVI